MDTHFGSNYDLKVGEIGVVVNDNEYWNGALLEVTGSLEAGSVYPCKILIKNPKNEAHHQPDQAVFWPASHLRRAATSDSTPRVKRVLSFDNKVISLIVRWTNKAAKLHRKGGPAVLNSGGTTEWWLNGLAHREDGPAVENSDGYKLWKRNGLLHREGGPAVIHPDGAKQWWVNGEQVSAPDPIGLAKIYEKLKAKPADFKVTDKTAKFEATPADQISAKTSSEIDDFLRQGRQRDLGNRQPRKNPTRRKSCKTQKPKKSWKLKAALGLAALSSAGALVFFLV